MLGLKKNIIKEIKIVCGGLAETPKIAEKVQKFLLNKIFNEEKINEAKKIIKKEFDPIDDMRASKNYRTKISQNLLERFLNENNKIKSTLY
jgi:xanthine dehydrogenase small subunit